MAFLDDFMYDRQPVLPLRDKLLTRESLARSNRKPPWDGLISLDMILDDGLAFSRDRLKKAPRTQDKDPALDASKTVEEADDEEPVAARGLMRNICG